MALTGTYKVEARTPMGMLTMNMIMEEANGVLNGAIDDGKDHADFTDGTFDGKAFNFKAELPSPFGSGTIGTTVTGEYDGADGISGKVKLPFGFAKFKGTRA